MPVATAGTPTVQLARSLVTGELHPAGGELGGEIFFESCKPLFGRGFGARDEYRLRVRRPQQPPAIGSAHPYAVDIGHLAPGSAQALADFTHDLELAAFRACKPQLGGVYHSRQLVAHLGEAVTAARQDAEQPHSDIDRVVEPVIAIGKEDV